MIDDDLIKSLSNTRIINVRIELMEDLEKIETEMQKRKMLIKCDSSEVID